MFEMKIAQSKKIKKSRLSRLPYRPTPKGYIIYSESTEQGFDRFDIKDNSSEEIRNATIEMFDKLENKNTKKFLENNIFFKEKIKNIVKFDNKHLKCFADISSDFIESNIK